MCALRFGSYSMCATLPATPNLLRLKSILRYARRAPPPRLREVTRPCELRPPDLRSGSSSDFSGVSRVISSRCVTARKRVPAVTGLNFLFGIPLDPFVHVDALAFNQRH